MHRDRRAARMFGAFASVLIAASACNGAAAPSAGTTSSAPSGSTGGGATQKVTFLTDFLLWGWHSPFFAGNAEGYFKEQGLDVTIQAGKGSVDTSAQLGAGAVQFGLVDIATALVAISKGADIKFVGVHLQKHPGGFLYIKERTKLDDWKDFEGKKLGGATGDAYFTALPSLMQQNTADFAKVTIVNMEGAATTGALISGQVDAIPGSAMTMPPRRAAAAEQKLTLGRFGFADHGFGSLGFAVAVNGKYLRDNPAAVQQFVNAWAKGMLFALANPDKAVDDFIAANPDKKKDLELESFNNSAEFVRGSGTLFKFDPARMASTVDFVNKAYGLDLKPEGLFTNEFIDKLPAGYTEGKM